MNTRKGTIRGSSAAVVALLLALAAPARAQDTCDVVVALADPGPLSILAYGIDYSGAGGDFVGLGFTPVCTKLVTGSEHTLWDDGSVLSDFVAVDPGISAPQALISCVFALDAGFPCPPPSAFVVTDQQFPPLEFFEFEDLFPGYVTPAVTVTVSPRVPVCGDGFREGAETCDDGNVVDGDCCSSACTLDAAGTACSDGSVCTSAETCDGAGFCHAGSVQTCDDGDPCTSDVCDAVLGCIAPAVPAHVSECVYGEHGSLALREAGAKSTLKSLITSRDTTSAAAAGDPTVDTAYALCIYDEAANVAALAARIDVPAGVGWQAISPTRFEYKNPTGSVDGVRRLRIDGKPNGSKVQLSAKGSNVPLPGPVAPDRYFARDNEVNVQLRNTAGGCWTLRLTSDLENDATEFKAKRK